MIEDLVGQTFGKLTVVSYCEKRKNKHYWNCICSCKNEKIVSQNNLKSGSVKSCGCLKKEYMSSKTKERNKKRILNLVGKRFERLLVIERVDNYVSPSGRTSPKWKCRCDCGNTIETLTRRLINGETKSCGCLKSETTSLRSLSNLKNKVFGLLVVKERAEDYVLPSGNKIPQWLCFCECGGSVVVQAKSLVSGSTKSCGCLNESFMASQLKNYFKKEYNAKVEYSIFKNPNTNHYLPYDIYIPYGENPNLNGFYIEVHGKQHYDFVEYFHKTLENFENCKKKDKLKKNFAKKHGIYIEIDLRKILKLEEAISKIINIINKMGLLSIH